MTLQLAPVNETAVKKASAQTVLHYLIDSGRETSA